MNLTPEQLVCVAMTNPVNAALMTRLPLLGVDQCMLTAGCLFQAVWNQRSHLPPAFGVKDYDVFYFDKDVSWEAENEVIVESRRLFEDLGVNVDIKNQARVHLWYAERFGRPYPQLLSVKDGIDRYLVAGTCVGLSTETADVYAPYGLDDIGLGLLRSNPKTPQPDLFVNKAKSYQERWPWLTIVGVD
ncbi:nucleotidyltransferase family protein [Pseudomonas sp. NPDC096917]|uniref:nucleotidyltransferase family protein n=1 Tax=Pseudomonas sp. NPDC096917 TaxID=3364483 RepID=UPI00383B6739